MSNNEVTLIVKVNQSTNQIIINIKILEEKFIFFSSKYSHNLFLASHKILFCKI
ncbi:MAG: hypothetical protein ACPHY8_05000 [Patescibacteria group bacterium]